jgi:ATP-binding cassette, subfamily B, multidrug efflux pump
MDIVLKNISVAKVDSLFDPTISLIVGISFFLPLRSAQKWSFKTKLRLVI